MLEGKQGAGAANAGLHLVHQQEPIPLLAQLRQFVHILPLHGEDTALSLDQLQQYGADIVSRRRLEGIHITRLRIPEALVKGEKVVVENVLSGGGES